MPVSAHVCPQVNEMHEVERLIDHATKKRSVGCTAMNSQVGTNKMRLMKRFQLV